MRGEKRIRGPPHKNNHGAVEHNLAKKSCETSRRNFEINKFDARERTFVSKNLQTGQLLFWSRVKR